MTHRALRVSLLAAAISGCATAPTTVTLPPVELPLPAPPVLPVIPEGDLMCLPDSAYGRLVERDAKLRAYAKELEAIIRATRHGR